MSLKIAAKVGDKVEKEVGGKFSGELRGRPPRWGLGLEASRPGVPARERVSRDRHLGGGRRVGKTWQDLSLERASQRVDPSRLITTWPTFKILVGSWQASRRFLEGFGVSFWMLKKKPFLSKVNRGNSIVMATPTGMLTFDPNGLFYKLVSAYKMGVCGQLIFHPSIRSIHSQSVGLASTEYPALEFSPQELLDSIRRENLSVGEATKSLLYMLINSAHEACQHKYGDAMWLTLRQQYPELEFFRHLRHAASHGGVWDFRKNEPNPNRKAEWRGRRVTRQLQGRPVWEINIKDGDVLVLLWDIEQILRSYP